MKMRRCLLLMKSSLLNLRQQMDKPKKIKEYIDHEMKMEEVLVAQFINKSDVTKGPEIGLFVFPCVFAYSMYVSMYVNLSDNSKLAVIDAV